jgi:hypothetical protein
MWSEECHFDVIIGWRKLIRNEKISAPRTNDTFRRIVCNVLMSER